MMIDKIGRCGLVRAGLVAILAGLLGACEQSSPAPVIIGGATEPMFTPMPAPPPSARHIIVRRGQSLGEVANLYHVPKSAIIAANGLRPPYELKIGAHLTIPYAGAPVPWASAPNAREPSIAAATPLPPPHPETLGPQQQATFVPPPLPAARVVPPQQQAAIPQPPPASVRGQPDVIPLDGPSPKEAAAAPAKPAPAATLTPSQPAGGPPPDKLASADGSPANAGGTVGGRFPWPVRGRILAGYGNTAGGGHNDGINIAAPLGTPVRAIEAGTVAYTGNVVKGYGNIILIRHADGWISAYAHLDNVTVKPGETIAAGQVIAKVGETGGVAEPQLHFELRRGKKPVNPKEFLAPAPSAEGFVGSRTG
jgi:murein DD-endopeptidase MepM/ murein hydrolase activator NlpD